MPAPLATTKSASGQRRMNPSTSLKASTSMSCGVGRLGRLRLVGASRSEGAQQRGMQGHEGRPGGVRGACISRLVDLLVGLPAAASRQAGGQHDEGHGRRVRQGAPATGGAGHQPQRSGAAWARAMRGRWNACNAQRGYRMLKTRSCLNILLIYYAQP